MPLRRSAGHAIAAAAGGPPGAAANPLTVPYQHQQQTEWCWAACAEMVFRFYGRVFGQQCDLADWLHGPAGCCANPGSGACNKACAPSDVALVYRNWRVRSSFVYGPILFPDLEAEIQTGQPVEVCWHQAGGTRHVVLVIGTQTNILGQWVRMHDPRQKVSRRQVLYNDLLTARGRGSWIFTWTGLR